MTTATVLERFTALIADRYVFPEVAEAIVAGLDGLSLDGSSAEEIATRLTARAQAVSNDRHLRVRWRPAGAPAGDADWDAHYAADAVRYAGGVKTVSRLDARTGLLEIAPYTSPVHLAEPYLAAAFRLLRGVERLVIDLRAGQGGTPETVAMICGYLLGREPVHLQDIVDRQATVRQYWSYPAAARLDDAVAICVLTSARTFSGCEELAYNLQARRRAAMRLSAWTCRPPAIARPARCSPGSGRARSPGPGPRWPPR